MSGITCGVALGSATAPVLDACAASHRILNTQPLLMTAGNHIFRASWHQGANLPTCISSSAHCHCLQDVTKLMAQVREKDFKIRDQEEAASLLSAQLQTTQGDLKKAEAAKASVLETVSEMVTQDEHMLNELGKAQVGLTACEPAGRQQAVGGMSCASGSCAAGPHWLHLKHNLCTPLEHSRQAERTGDQAAAQAQSDMWQAL